MLTTMAHIMHQLLKIHFYSNIPLYFAKYTLTIFDINHRKAQMKLSQYACGTDSGTYLTSYTSFDTCVH